MTTADGASRRADLMPALRRVTAPNPGPMTHTGTQTYVLGTRAVAVIDPGPADPGHLQAILDAVPQGGQVTRILVTHPHLDHSAGAPALSAATGAPVAAFGRAGDGQSPSMRERAAKIDLAGGEGVDTAFRPDITIADGERVTDDGWDLIALHTPGHMSAHLSFVWPQAGAIFTGDHVMGWSSTLISPPDGDLGDFMGSLAKLLDRPESTYLPGHGPVVEDGRHVIRQQQKHRKEREAQILSVLERGAAAIADITGEVYRDVPRHLHPAAARNVLAHLIHLAERNIVAMPEDAPLRGLYRLSDQGEKSAGRP